MHLEHRWGWQEISSQWVWSSLPRMQVSPLFPLQGQLLWETGEDAANPWLLRFILLMGHFIVLTFRSLMHFQLILTHGVRWDPTSFFYMWTCTYTSITVEKTGTPLNCLGTFKSINCKYEGFFPNFQFNSIYPYIYSYCSSMLFWLLQLYSNF